MIEEGISYPIRSDNWVAQHIIGGMLWLFSWLLFPAFFIFGYYMDASKRIIQGDDEPPDFDDWGELLILGLKGTAVSIIYTTVPVVLVVMLAILVWMFGLGLGSTGFTATGVALIFVAIIVYLLSLYILPASLIHMTMEDDLTAAFHMETIAHICMSGGYILSSLVTVVIGIVGLIAMAVFSTITFGIGSLFVPFFTHTFYLAAVSFYAENYRDLLGQRDEKQTTVA